MAALKCVRLFRMGRFFKVMRSLKLGTWMGVARLYLFIVLLVHWGACGYEACRVSYEYVSRLLSDGRAGGLCWYLMTVPTGSFKHRLTLVPFSRNT